MYVIVHDELPDVVVMNEEDLRYKIMTIPNCSAYQYVFGLDGIWKVGNMISVYEDELLYHTGTWFCPDSYRTYKFPNICKECKLNQFMKGTSCLYCEEQCLDCGKVKDCRCAFTDY